MDGRTVSIEAARLATLERDFAEAGARIAALEGELFALRRTLSELVRKLDERDEALLNGGPREQ